MPLSAHIHQHAFSALIASLAASPFFPLAVFFSVMVSEDAVPMIVGILSAEGAIEPLFALMLLLAGVFASNLVCYLAGRAANTHPRLARILEHERVASLQRWFATRPFMTVFSAQFVPGTRIATFVSSGFFRVPLTTFSSATMSALVIWVTLLFFASYWFGAAAAPLFGRARWLIALVVILVVLVAIRAAGRAEPRPGGSD
jgi:membrane protein DedA with SNARE-associated domain